MQNTLLLSETETETETNLSESRIKRRALQQKDCPKGISYIKNFSILPKTERRDFSPTHHAKHVICWF